MTKNISREEAEANIINAQGHASEAEIDAELQRVNVDGIIVTYTLGGLWNDTLLFAHRNGKLIHRANNGEEPMSEEVLSKFARQAVKVEANNELLETVESLKICPTATTSWTAARPQARRQRS